MLKDCGVKEICMTPTREDESPTVHRGARPILVTAVSGIIAQVTARQKTLAEIERDVAMLDIERQKLQLERERLQLEQEKGAGGGVKEEEEGTTK
jgi:hypothetical protein